MRTRGTVSSPRKPTGALSPATTRYRERQEDRRHKENEKRKASGKFNPLGYDWATPEERLQVLVEHSVMLIEPITYDELLRRRRGFDNVKGRLFPLTIFVESKILKRLCWVCRTQDAAHRHHVVLLKNGGRPTAKSNIVLLCEACHVSIHPWMHLNESKPVGVADFELARAKSEVTLLLEKAAKGRFSTTEIPEKQICDIVRRVFNSLEGRELVL